MESSHRNTYLIGEIGQNHNGSVELAKQMVDLTAAPVEEELFQLNLKGLDAVKLTKRDLRYELSASAYNQAYISPHSFGDTYGQHREYLELSEEEHFEIFTYAKGKGLEVIETLCAPTCLSLLKLFVPDRIKVASRDLTNLPLLEAIAETGVPVIISTGMGGKVELDQALEAIARYHSEVSILHCVSEYPTHPQHVNLNSIPYLKKHYPQHSIGYSDHTIGISTPVAAVAMGAEIIEKHITIDRSLKGTDQAGSLGKDGVRRMVRDIRLLELSFGREEIFIEPAVSSAKQKLERSIASKRNLQAGKIIKEEDLHLLSPGLGFRWSERDKVIGKTLLNDLEMNELIMPNMLSHKINEDEV